MRPGAFEHLCWVLHPTEVARRNFRILLQIVCAANFQLFHSATIGARQAVCARHTVCRARSRDINSALYANAISDLCGSQEDRGGALWAFLARLCSPIILVVACPTWCAIFSGLHSLGSSCWTKVTVDLTSSWLLLTCGTFFADIGVTLIVREAFGVRAGKACLSRFRTNEPY